MPLDSAGAFATTFAVPENAPSGDYALLAQAAGGVGGATVARGRQRRRPLARRGRVSAAAICDWRQRRSALRPRIARRSDGATLPSCVRRTSTSAMSADNASVGDDAWLDEPCALTAAATRRSRIPHPNDELASTYGVHVESGGATADTRFVVPTARARSASPWTAPNRVWARRSASTSTRTISTASRSAGAHGYRRARPRNGRKRSSSSRSMPTGTRAALSSRRSSARTLSSRASIAAGARPTRRRCCVDPQASTRLPARAEARRAHLPRRRALSAAATTFAVDAAAAGRVRATRW